jgi:hypothetical protein
LGVAPSQTFGARSHYLSVPRKADGNTTCNICQGTTELLTEDHVPPQSCLIERRVQIEPFEHAFRSQQPGLPISQNGLRYKTICGPCNSLLGARYDPALTSLCLAVRGRFGPAFLPASTWTTWCRPGLVVRSLFGHLLAATTDDAQTTPDAAMRACVLDEDAPLPTTLRVFYWLHLHPEVKVRRSLAMPARRGRFREGVGVFELIKFSPLGFAVTHLDDYESLPRIDTFARSGGGEVEIPFSTSLAVPADWPERVDEGNYVMGGRSLEDAVTARPHRKLRQPSGP